MSSTEIDVPPVMTMPFPLQGPISDARIVMFDEFESVTQSPFGFVTWRFCRTVPLCPLIFTGPEATNCPCAAVASDENNKIPNVLKRTLDNLGPII